MIAAFPHGDPHGSCSWLNIQEIKRCNCGSKPVHAAKGYCDGADAFISYHPHFANTAIWDTQCGAYWSVVFTFETTTPEKWIDKSLIPTTHTSHAAGRYPVRSTRSA